MQPFKSLACIIDTDTGFELSLNIKGDNVCTLPQGLCQLHTLELFEKKASSDQTKPWGIVLIISYCRKAQSTMDSTLTQEGLCFVLET